MGFSFSLFIDVSATFLGICRTCLHIVEKKTVILDGARRFPIERSGLKQMEAACIESIEQHLNANQ